MYALSVLFAAAAGVTVLALPGAARAAASICDAQAGNLIANCGFENTDASMHLLSWTNTGDTQYTFVDDGSTFGAPNSGRRFALIGPPTEGFLSQTFADLAGQTLRIEFYYASDGVTPQDFHATFNNTTLLSLTDDAAHGYTHYVFFATATGLDTLEFGGMTPNGWISLDDVYVGVAEPGSLALLGIALAGAGVLRRCRRSA
jgi:hypothetical protein